MNRLILTTQPVSMAYALDEIIRCDPKALAAERLDDGIVLVEHEITFEMLAKRLMRNVAVFSQHICPVNAILSYDDDIKKILVAVETNLYNVIPPLALQIRYLNVPSNSINKRDLSDAIISLIRDKGFEINARSPETVISVLATPFFIYLGVSPAAYNINARGGRAHGFGRLDEKISRSELKLLEAIELFKLDLPNEGRAIDLGAAPGGWSHALAEMGMKVDAVDPAALDGHALSNANISHYRMTAQQYLPQAKPAVLIVNDMKMDAVPSARLMLDFKKIMTDSGIVIMTLKLPKEGFKTHVNTAIKILEKGYAIIGARQLYNNRSEVTVAMRAL